MFYIYIYIIYIYIYIYIYVYIYISKEAIDNADSGAGGYNFIYPWKFWTKQSFFQGNSANCVTPIGKRPKTKIIGNFT